MTTARKRLLKAVPVHRDFKNHFENAAYRVFFDRPRARDTASQSIRLERQIEERLDGIKERETVRWVIPGLISALSA